MFAVLFLAMTKPSRSILFAIAAIAGFNQFCYFQLSLTDQLTLAGLVLRPTLSDFFCYIAVQTIASSFDALSLSRSRCFRLRPVAHCWASKSIREGFTSAFQFFYGRSRCCQFWLLNHTMKLRQDLYHSELVIIVAVDFRCEAKFVFQNHQRFVGDLGDG